MPCDHHPAALDAWQQLLNSCTCAAQRSICTELVRRLQRHSAAYTRATAFAAELDCLLAMTSAAKDFGLARPLLTPGDVLYIKQGAPLR